EDESPLRLKEIGVLPERIMVADNGVRLAEGPLGSLHSARPSILFVSRLVRHKRCDDLLFAYKGSGLAQKGVNVTIVGDGEERQALEALAGHLGLSGSVAFTGYRDDVLSLMAHSICLVVCSEKEGMPNVILEAMSVGVPIIATKVGG